MKHLRSTNGPTVDSEWAEYRKYLQSIKDSIPDALFRFAQLNLHDSQVLRITTPRKNSLSIVLSKPAYEDIDSITITVERVAKAFAPEKFVNQWLWGHEVALSDLALFEIRAKLLTGELFICANSFTMEIEPIAPANGRSSRR